MQYGGDYNPEQWPQEIWRDDVALMRACGVNLVSVGIFSWAWLEPEPGRYETAWLDEVLDLLHAGGIAVNLATATASPPPWMAHRHPESLPVDRRGRVLGVGSRQQYCPHAPAYREGAARLVRMLAERYGRHPALAMWHVNNEFGCHVHESFTPAAHAAWQAWLRDRYVTVDGLNHAWGTAFWSQRYGGFDEIPMPGPMPTFANPTMLLDWRRFSSWSIERLLRDEVAILREVTPDVPVNTNFMGFFEPLDYWSMAAVEDVVSDDNYQDPADPEAHITSAARSDLMRSLRRGQPWLLMEQTPSTVNWRRRNVTKAPGRMRSWSLQCVAHGADGVMFFQWRAARAGAERFHGAMVPHAGPDSRVYREVAGLGADLARLAPVVGSRVRADVGIVFDWDSWWAVGQSSHPSSDITGREHEAWHRALFLRNIATDYVSVGHTADDLRAYKLVLVPNLYVIREGFARALRTYVDGGGHVVVGPFSAIVDEHLHVGLGGYPAALRDLLGIRIEEMEAMAGPNAVMVDGARLSCSAWHDALTLHGATPLGTFARDWFAGEPAITHHRVGAGTATYVGTVLGPEGLDWLLSGACLAAGVSAPVEVPPGVEVAVRTGPADRFVFLLNHTDEPVTVAVPPGAVEDLLADAPIGARPGPDLTVAPRGVVVLRCPL